MVDEVVAPPPLRWHRLGAGPSELRLEFTLPTGQSFRWRQTGPYEFTGVVGTRVVVLRQAEDDVLYTVLARGHGAAPGGDSAAVLDYFNMGPGKPTLAAMADEWAAACSRFAAVRPYFPGARMLRQDPVECLFSFICSQNNHISRIHGMVERLCAMYGSPLHAHAAQPAAAGAAGADAAAAAAGDGVAGTAGLTTPVLVVERCSDLNEPTPAAASAFASSSDAGSTGTIATSTGSTGRGSAAVVADLSPDSPPVPGDSSVELSGLAVPSVWVAGASPVPSMPSTHACQQTAAGVTPAKGHVQLAAMKGSVSAAAHKGSVAAAAAAGQACGSFYAFPTLEQLGRATEEELRAAGFGYRAKYIVGAAQQLLAQEGGGRQWLTALRATPRDEAVAALCTLPGIGPKVAACVSLFSLDKHDVIPVDTHVWQIAVRYYTPHLRGKTLTPRLHEQVADAFVQRFGAYAGWAHNTLFISELASQQHRLPAKLQNGGARGGTAEGAKKEPTTGGGVEGMAPAVGRPVKRKAGAVKQVPSLVAAAATAEAGEVKEEQGGDEGLQQQERSVHSSATAGVASSSHVEGPSAAGTSRNAGTAQTGGKRQKRTKRTA